MHGVNSRYGKNATHWLSRRMGQALPEYEDRCNDIADHPGLPVSPFGLPVLGIRLLLKYPRQA